MHITEGSLFPKWIAGAKYFAAVIEVANIYRKGKMTEERGQRNWDYAVPLWPCYLKKSPLIL